MKHEKLYILSIVFCITILSIVGRSCTSQKRTALIQHYEKLISDEGRETKKWKDAYGNEHITAVQLKLEKEVVESANIEQARLLKIKPKQIQGVTKYTTSVDTFFVFDTSYQDPWITLKYVHDTLNLTMRDSLSIVQYQKRNKILFLPIGKKQTYIDIYNRNKHIKLGGVITYSVKQPKHKVEIVLYGGWDFINNRFSAGIGIVPSFLTIKL